jgi:hypothetical protein
MPKSGAKRLKTLTLYAVNQSSHHTDCSTATQLYRKRIANQRSEKQISPSRQSLLQTRTNFPANDKSQQTNQVHAEGSNEAPGNSTKHLQKTQYTQDNP